jgi:hypothetical protein
MGNRIRGEGLCLNIGFDCSTLIWDHGLVNCGTNILHGCWLFCQKRFVLIAGHPSLLLSQTELGWEWWCLAISFNWDHECVICGTNIFCGCWLLLKRNSGLLLDIFQYWCRKQTEGGTGHFSPFDLVAQHQTQEGEI